jgi:cell division protein FtsI/penicillin-binding protein 2
MTLSVHARRRLFYVLLVLCALLCAWLLKLSWMQTFGSQPHAALAVKQRQQSFVLDDGRGQFVDRFGRPLHAEQRRVLVVFPEVQKQALRTEQLAALWRILETDEARWQQFLRTLNGRPRAWQGQGQTHPQALSLEQQRALAQLNIHGLVPASLRIRTAEQAVARQVLGVVAENATLLHQLYPAKWAAGELLPTDPVGVSGLERTFDAELRGPRSTRLVWQTGSRQPLRVIEQTSAWYPLTVKTTLDRDIQQLVERALATLRIRQGAVVVLDAQTADVRAMASHPALRAGPLRSGADYSNHGLRELPPGSIFKTVIAAAALAEGNVNAHSTFTCQGAYGRYRFTCWRRAGHGTLTAEQAFAQSCNLAFGELARTLGAARISEYAKRLGLAQPMGAQWSNGNLPDEPRGLVFANPEQASADPGAIMQTAIGQRDVRLTPLQAANMMVTILNNGQLREPRIVQEIRYRNGQLKRTYAPVTVHASDVQLAAAAPILKRWLRATVRTGTAAQALATAAWPLAGKTGTAQVRVNGQDRVHQWFVGYGPATSTPRYVVAVVVENVHPRAPQLALPLTRQIFAGLAR